MKNQQHTPTLAENGADAPLPFDASQDLDLSEDLDSKPSKNEFLLLERLHYLSQATHAAQSIESLLTELKTPLLNIFNSENVTLFVVDQAKRQIYSKIKTEGKIDEIRLPLSRESIAGYVGVDKKLVNIPDVQIQENLTAIHPELKFDAKWDALSGAATKSILAVPLVYEGRIQGVLELINKKDEGEFDAVDENNAFLAAETLALALHNLKKLSTRRTKFSYLIDSGLASQKDIDDSFSVARETGLSVEDVLIRDFNLSRGQIGKSEADYYETPYQGYDSGISLPDPEILGLNVEELREQEWIPLRYDESGIFVLLNNPGDHGRLEKIRQCFPGQEVSFRFGLKSDLNDCFNSLFSGLDEIENEQATEPFEGEMELDFQKADDVEVSASEREILDDILSAACEHQVTDIHIEPGGKDKNILVRLRKDGVCRTYAEFPCSSVLIQHIKTRAKLDAEECRKPQSGSFSWKRDTQNAVLEAVIFPTIGGVEDAMLRVVSIGKPTAALLPLGGLNLSEPNMELIINTLEQKNGFILAVGDEGSGKTTGLHGILNHLNNSEKKILTAENPVEIIQPGIRQMNVDLDSGISMACALQTFLKGSPDVILAGDLPDQETFQQGVEAAEKHLFLASMTAGSIAEAIEKIKTFTPAMQNFSDALSLIIFQKSVTTLCAACKVEYHPSREEYDELARFYGEQYFSELGVEYNDYLLLQKAPGCKQCLQSGYRGRTVLHETWAGTPKLKELIAEGSDFPTLRRQAFEDGMIAINQDAVYKVFKGDCDFRQIQAAAGEK